MDSRHSGDTTSFLYSLHLLLLCKYILIKATKSNYVKKKMLRKLLCAKIKCWDSYTVGRYPGFCSMKQTRSIATPPGWDASPTPGNPSAFCSVSPNSSPVPAFIYSWVERGTMRVQCLAQEHNTVTAARTWTRTTRKPIFNQVSV